MIQIGSVLKVADNSGARYFKVITVLGGSKRRFGYIGDIVSGVVHKAAPDGSVRDHEKVYAVIVRTKKEKKRKDGSYIRFDDNAVVLINKKTNEPIGTAVFGPIAREIKDKGFNKIASLALELL
ncbi:MAG: 50S ribosomal protein L14 [Candidatus Dojkabacteria bacterium]|jgi:large subunit ribosomal protein L14|nr:MAG: 50S ribosomal protein L14 [Candidatus Dojkabacteria bacterium]